MNRSERTQQPWGSFDSPTTYRIELRDRLEGSWALWFNGMRVSECTTDEGECGTELVGLVADQAALHGLLSKIRDLNLTIVSLRRIRPTEGQDETRDHL